MLGLVDVAILILGGRFVILCDNGAGWWHDWLMIALSTLSITLFSLSITLSTLSITLLTLLITLFPLCKKDKGGGRCFDFVSSFWGGGFVCASMWGVHIDSIIFLLVSVLPYCDIGTVHNILILFLLVLILFYHNIKVVQVGKITFLLVSIAFHDKMVASCFI